MQIADITRFLETIAPPALQEGYDNAGLLTGQAGWACTGALCTLDATEAVIMEAVEKNCNLVVAHHPIIFGGLKKINGKNYVEKAIIAAIKNDIAIYAIHTNLDNVLHGVNHRMANCLGLQNRRILAPKTGQVKKIFTFVPATHVDAVRNALFTAGAGQIGNYSECSFAVPGTGTFRAGAGSNPFVGTVGERAEEPEIKIEAIFPAWLQQPLVAALCAAHPYEEVAYDIVSLDNQYAAVGSGLLGSLPQPVPELDFLQQIKAAFGLQLVRHTPLTGKPVQKVALCGGAGSFLISRALGAGADFYITADVKYHEFFDANGGLVVADIGHWESEQFTIDLLFDHLTGKFPTFAVQKTAVKTNPVHYF
jgi:dinuclear metal center YbgI/SA1388 family protein